MIETPWSDTPIKDIPNDRADNALATDVSPHLRSMVAYLSGRDRLDQAGLDALLDEAGDVLRDVVDADEESTPREAYTTTRALDIIMLGLLQMHNMDAILDSLPGGTGERVREYFANLEENNGV